MKKRTLAFLLALAMCLAMLPAPAMAAETASGACGDNLTWSLDDTGTLTISGTGAMTNYDNSFDLPWRDSLTAIKTATIEDGVTSIGNYAFQYCTDLTNIAISDSVTCIGKTHSTVAKH